MASDPLTAGVEGLTQLTNQTVGQFLGSSLSYAFGGRAEKRSNRRSEQMTARMMDRQAHWDAIMAKYGYGLSRQAYDYSNAEQYRLAQMYAENSAKWQVQGLRNAGLNPILAATDGNFRGTFGDVGQMTYSPASSPSGSQFRSAGSNFSVSQGPNLARALADFSSAKQTAVDTNIKEQTAPDVVSQNHNAALKSAYDVNVSKEQSSLIQSQAALNLAEAEKVKSTARQLDSNTALNLIRAENEKDTGGVQSKYGLISSLLRAFLPDFRDSNTARRHITEQIKESVAPPPLTLDPSDTTKPFVPSRPKPMPSSKPVEIRYYRQHTPVHYH